jgi:hypothetical protein
MPVVQNIRQVRKNRAVSPSDAFQMSKLSPTGRVEWLLGQVEFSNAHTALQSLLDQYDSFLKFTDAPESELVQRFQDKDIAQQYRQEAYKLGDCVFQVLPLVSGENNLLYRLLVV